MPALFFPTLDALRLALASGLLPASVTTAPVAAARDEHGHVWIELTDFPSRDALASLGRLGVVAAGRAGAPTAPARCWAELLPLRRAAPAPGSVLFDVPDKLLAAFVARLRRQHAGAVGVRLLPDPHAGRAWVSAHAPPLSALLWAEEADAPVRAYHQQAPGVWTARGWEHPLAGQLAVPPGRVLLCDPERGAVAHPAPVPLARDDEFALSRHAVRAAAFDAPAKVAVRFRLARCDAPVNETLWVLDAVRQEAFREFCRAADERLLRRFEIATVEIGDETRMLVRRAADDAGAPVLPAFVGGYCADPRLPSLFVPAGFALRPRTRATELARELPLRADRLTWLEPTGDGFATHAVPASAFRALADQMEWTAPPGVALSFDPVPVERLPFAKFVLRVETVHEPEPVAEPEVADAPLADEVAEPVANEPGWVAKSVSRVFRWMRREPRAPAEPEPPTPTRPPREAKAPQPEDALGERVEQKLSSADALLHGHDRAARRHDLESRLLADFPRLDPDERAARWAELGGVYGATGQALDAAVCWVNAAWECAAPPADWLDRWADAECRAVKRGERAADLDRWLAEPGRPGTGRVVAALAARAGFQPVLAPEFVASLPRVLAVLDQHFDDIPVRGAWLARLAVARSCDGDVLGLARWRDRLINRLHDRGPGLDLDEPSFLRFRGTATADRFKTAREWLTRVKEPVLAWVQRHAGGGRLEWAGLEAETEATAVYAQFLLAWGLGALGERAGARDWAARARKALARAGGPRADPAAHALLGDLFLHRIKDAHEGGTPKPGLPPELRERLDKLPEFARYSVDRLREHCRVLEPLGGVRGSALALKPFWGTDRLGERLSVFGDHVPAAHLNDEARALLAIVAETPSVSTVPRVVFALLEVAAYLDSAALDTLLGLVPTALDWMEAWVQAGPWREAERAGRVAHYQKTMIDSAFAVAPSASAATALLRHLTRGATAGHLLPAASAAAPRVFRAARKFGLVADADALMRVLDPACGEWGTDPLTAERVGLAVGWFAAGDEEAGNRILNAARDYLFLSAPADPEQRTAIALAYAEALGFAPAVRLALGRLEELFQRLDRVTVGRSTNCYFTLQPLRLIDTVVRSVVTDEFTLGATVRAWLDEDEFLIRRRIHRDMAALLRDSAPS